MTCWVPLKKAETTTRQDGVPAGLKSLIKAGFSSLDQMPEIFVLFVFSNAPDLKKLLANKL
jgi:hypothetical protein